MIVMQVQSVPQYQVLHGGKQQQQVFISAAVRTSGLTSCKKSSVASTVRELALVRSYSH